MTIWRRQVLKRRFHVVAQSFRCDVAADARFVLVQAPSGAGPQPIARDAWVAGDSSSSEADLRGVRQIRAHAACTRIFGQAGLPGGLSSGRALQ
jgi:hypothetical protein